jgi:hypothetical protein
VLAAPRLARQRYATAFAPLSIRGITPPHPQLATAESSSLNVTRVRNAVDASGPVTTFATLVRALNIDSDPGEKRLREILYNLRIERIIEFDRPLGRFTAIRPRGPAPS